MAISAGISQSSFSRVLSQVLNAMFCRVGRYIKFPNIFDELNATNQGFYEITGFPYIGAIDCTHVHLVPPSDRERLFTGTENICIL